MAETHCHTGFSHLFLCRRIGVDPVNHCPNAQPNGEVGEHFHNTALVGERCLLEDRQVLHHAILDNVLHNLVDKINLAAIQLCTV